MSLSKHHEPPLSGIWLYLEDPDIMYGWCVKFNFTGEIRWRQSPHTEHLNEKYKTDIESRIKAFVQ